jgi:hypothetical protein
LAASAPSIGSTVARRDRAAPPATHGGAPHSIDIAAPPHRVVAVWMDLDRMFQWVCGVTRMTDLSGPIDAAGSR